MRKLILNIATSLDGFIEGPHGEYDWCFTDDYYGMNAFLQRTDAIFFGRKSYELFTASFAHMWNDRQHYVFSNSLLQVPEGVQQVKGDVTNRVLSIKAEAGKDIWLFGGASLASSLIDLNLVDELLIAIHPILLGGGKTFFQSGNRALLRLVETKSYPSGLVQNRYNFMHDKKQ